MDHSTTLLSPQLASVLGSTNISSIPGDDLDLFFHCWIQPHCPACLSASNPYPCSWCATSQTCVPNTIYPYPFGILSPLKSAEICPLAWRERWEMRARPFSCRCSSMTLVSVVVAVLTTLTSLYLIWASLRIGGWIGRKWRKRKQGWWRLSNWVPRWMSAWRKRKRKDASTGTDAEAEAERDTGGVAASAEETTPLLA